MYLKKTPNPHGRIRLSIVDTYYDKVKKAKQKGSENLIDLQEINLKINELSHKLNEIGDSL